MIRRSIFISLVIIVLALAAHISHILSIHRMEDDAMAPAYMKGRFILTSNLKTYHRNNVVRVSVATETGSQKTYIRRIVGLEGDTIEFNDGFLMRNYYLADNPDRVMFTYFVPYNLIKHLHIFDTLQIAPVIRTDSAFLTLTYSEYQMVSRHILLHKLFKGGNPLVVPKGHCFVISDNRGNTEDSRKWGCIPFSCIKGTAL